MKADKGRKRRSSRPVLETVIIVGLSLKLTVTAFFLLHHPTAAVSILTAPPAMAQETAAPVPPPAPATTLPPAATGNATYDQMINMLQSREQTLNQKEQRLNEREKALGLLEQDLNDRLREIEGQRKRLEELVAQQERLLQEQKVLKNARIEHLVDAYKSMRPERAGALVNSLDEPVAVQILAAMPGRNVGQILAFTDPDKAARLTKAISELKKTQAPPPSGDAGTAADNAPAAADDAAANP